MTQTPPESQTEPRRLDVEQLFHSEIGAMPLETRARAHEAALRMFEIDADEVGLKHPGEMLGTYRILRILGCGGQAFVYEAEDTDLGRVVALKVPRPGVADRLMKEARTVGALEHPGIVRVEAIRDHDDLPFLVMERCPGGNLADLLTQYPAGLPLFDVKRIGGQVLEALAYAHERGIVHRDVKPANVLFDAEGNAKLGDFGIGKVAADDAFQHSIEASQITQGAIGTPLYMAPEQRDPSLLRGSEIDGRADLYGFGRMLWFMLTGSNPDDYQPASRIRTELDPAWDELIYQLTAKDREQRLENAQSVVSSLQRMRTWNQDAVPLAPTPRSVPRATPQAVKLHRQRTGKDLASSKAFTTDTKSANAAVALGVFFLLLAPLAWVVAGSGALSALMLAAGVGVLAFGLLKRRGERLYALPRPKRRGSSLAKVLLLLGGVGFVLFAVLALFTSRGAPVAEMAPTPGPDVVVMDPRPSLAGPTISVGRTAPRNYLGTGQALLRAGRTKDAIASLRRAVQAQPQSAEAWAYLAKALYADGKRNEANNTFNHAKDLDPRRYNSKWADAHMPGNHF